MLANLVRLYYRDSPYFLEVSSIATQYTYAGSLSASVNSISTGGTTIGGVGGGVAYEERPTVTYLPLKGNDFVTRMLAPIPWETIVLLNHSGWRVDRLLRCGVQRMNDLRNAPTASGPTPDRAPEFKGFVEMSAALNRLFQTRAAEVRFRPIGAGSSEDAPMEDRFAITMVFEDREDAAADVETVKRLLGLSIDLNEFRLTGNPTYRRADEIGILPRSLLGVMSYLSQTVEPLQRDVDAGRITITRTPEGEVFDWNELTGGLFEIQSSLEQPRNAFVQVHYRDAWFYIDDADLTSKSTFTLIGQLFELQAGDVGGVAPLLTLPIGN